MAHIKKTQMPKSWPVPRKGRGKRFVAVPSHASSKGISLLFLLRDVLKLVKTRKEAKHMTFNGMVKVNNQVRKDENFPCQVFDVLNLEKAKLNYRLEIVNRKFALKEISDKEAGSKIVKISGKKVLGKGKVQMNLDDGQNVLSKEKFSVGDSIVLNTVENKIEKVLPLKVGAKVEVVVGKHAGEKGELVGFEELVRGRNYKIKLEDKTVSLPYKTILVIG
jgi:small subunit ribosomal protein S4e